jgi:MtrB/PioB family decaheme-associated outer membrane protein
MAPTKSFLASSLSLALLFFLPSASPAQIDVGNYTISGEVEVGGMPRHKSGDTGKFEEYRDIPESVVVPQLQLMIGGKKEDFYLTIDASQVGRNDQNYRLRFGRYGLLDIEFEWDQIPHIFNVDTARTPYVMNGGVYTLGTNRPGAFTGPAVRDWVNANAQSVDLKMFNGFGRFKARYTPTPGWSFTASYGSQNTTGKRAFGALFGPSPGSYNITELAEPIDYQTHNIELGGEYAGQGWSIGLKYNGSLFHNNTSTLIWDNPIHALVGGNCLDSATYTPASGIGPCRGRLDLYPSNQAHGFTLTGTAGLPFKSRFLATVSYGWRLQNEKFLPFTINSCYGSGPVPATCADGALTAMPRLLRRNLDGDVRPLMINATLVNNFIDRLNLKAYYRFYDLDNKSKSLFFPDGIIINDRGAPADVGSRTFPYAYSKQNVGLEAGYDITRWLAAKLGYGWERMHREGGDVLTSDEHSVGPTVDIKPSSWLLFRASYKYSLRNAPNYNNNRLETTDPSNLSRKFFQAKRDRNKVSLFTQVTPWDALSIHAGFEFTGETYLDSTFGTQNDFNYSPSLGFLYAPLDWVRFFVDYNWDRYDWKLNARSTNPWFSRGRDQVHTISLGSDLDIVRDLFGIRLQYGFSDGRSAVRASGGPAPPNQATDYPTISNRWHEFLARLEYRVHKNIGLNLGYYFNRYNTKDYGVDIMKPWMGDIDPGPNVQHSIFLGDQLKGPYTAHVGFIGLKLKF